MESNEGSAATPDKQIWIFVSIGVVLIALALGAFLLFRTEAGGKGNQDERSRGFGIKQASWTVRIRTVEGPALPDRKHGVSKKEGRRLGRLIKSIYNAAYLRPDRMDKVVRKYVAPRAAGAIKKWGPKIPKAAREIKTHERAAIVGVDPRSTSRAVARVRVVASGKNRGKKFKTLSSDRLWLEKSKGRWNVIAYDVTRNPLPLEPSGKKAKDGKGGTEEPQKDAGKRNGKKGGKKDGKESGKKSGGKGDKKDNKKSGKTDRKKDDNKSGKKEGKKGSKK
jgi:hypothetical protein